jgi:hypothetical protein
MDFIAGTSRRAGMLGLRRPTMDHLQLAYIAEFLSLEREADRFVRLDEMHCFLKHRWPYHEHRDSRLDSFALGASAIEATHYLTKDADPILARMDVED